MSTLLYALGRWSYRHSWRVLIAWLLLLALGGVGAVTLGQGTDNSFSIPGTESQAGIEQLNRTFPQASGTSAQMIIVTADDAAIEGEPYATAIAETIAEFEDLDGILAVTDPFSEIVNGQVSDDGSAAIVRMQFDGQATDVPPGHEDGSAGCRGRTPRRTAGGLRGRPRRRPLRRLRSPE